MGLQMRRPSLPLPHALPEGEAGAETKAPFLWSLSHSKSFRTESLGSAVSSDLSPSPTCWRVWCRLCRPAAVVHRQWLSPPHADVSFILVGLGPPFGSPPGGHQRHGLEK